MKRSMNIRKVFRRTHDPIWQLQIGVIAVMILQILTDHSFLPYNKYFIVAIEAILLIGLAAATSDGYTVISSKRRSIALILIAIVAIVNFFSLGFLVQALLYTHVTDLGGTQLLLNGITIYLTNIFVFALWYWELDGNGPDRRTAERERQRDFAFPQMVHNDISPKGWLPGFVDYLYLSTTNVMNFASADTIPLSHRSKLLMMTQALLSLVIVVLVIARAISGL